MGDGVLRRAEVRGVCGLQAMLVSAGCASGAMLTLGSTGGLEGVLQSLAVLQSSRGLTLGARYWILESPLSADSQTKTVK